MLRLLERHLSFAHAHVSPEDRHALDVDGLMDPAVTFYGLRVDGELLAVGALKRLDDEHAELRSMHTAESARKRGLGRAMLGHLLRVAGARGFRRVSIETGSAAVFAPARALHSSAGFTACGPFAQYRTASQPASVAVLAIELSDEIVDSPGDLVAGRADLLDRSPFRIRQFPVDVALAGDERAGVAAAHRDDDVGLLCELACEALRAMAGEVDCELAHHFDDRGVNVTVRVRFAAG